MCAQLVANHYSDQYTIVRSHFKYNLIWKTPVRSDGMH